VFSHSFKDERFLNEIVANPYLDYKEENESSPQGEDLLFITIKKWDM
jgi:hypothetical protein